MDPELAVDSQLPVIATTLARAFADDPVQHWLFASAPDQFAAVERFMAFFAERYLPLGRTFVAGAGVAGAALWAPPGQHTLGADDLEPLVALVSAEIGTVETEAKLGELGRSFGYLPEEPHFYLGIAGVDPDHQSTGVGSALLGPCLAVCDAEGVTAHLESSNPRNIPFYERHGFAVVDAFTLGGPDGPAMTPMTAAVEMSAGPEDLDLDAASLWMIRGGDDNRLVHDFLTQGVTGVAFTVVPDGRTVSRAQVLRLLTPAGATSPNEVDANMFLSFVHRVKPGDVVVMPDPQTKGLASGLVTGDYAYHDDLDLSRCRHRRLVEWRRRIDYASLPERLAKLPTSRGTLREVPDGRLKALAHAAFLHEIGEDPFVRPHRAPVRSSSPRRSSTGGRVVKPPPRPVETRRCQQCLMSKPLDRFDGDSDYCQDCL